MNRNQVETGLENVVAAATQLSDIDTENSQIIVRGYNLEIIAPKISFEAMIYLLLENKLPSEAELHTFIKQLNRNRELTNASLSILHQAAVEKLKPIDALSAVISSLYFLPNKASQPKDQCLQIIAQIPVMLAAYHQFLLGKQPLKSKQDLGFVANFLYLFFAEDPSQGKVHALETYLNTVIDHGLNASTFTARVIASTRTDLIGCVCGALAALKGPLHGGAPGPVLEMVLDIQKNKAPQKYIEAKLAKGERIMGFGHRVYRERDPRAAILETAAKNSFTQSSMQELYQLFREVETTTQAILQKHKPNRVLKANVEFYTALVLYGIGFNPEYFTPIFALSRVVGWLAHSLEQQQSKKLIRPQSIYIGKRGLAL